MSPAVAAGAEMRIISLYNGFAHIKDKHVAPVPELARTVGTIDQRRCLAQRIGGPKTDKWSFGILHSVDVKHLQPACVGTNAKELPPPPPPEKQASLAQENHGFETIKDQKWKEM